MPRRDREDEKTRALRERGALNRRPERVQDPLFLEEEFFDARDLVQVKYEMLRRVQKKEYTARRAAAQFGFSRPAFYRAQEGFEREGLPGLLGRKRGPHGGHKLTGEVLKFIQEVRTANPSVSAKALLAAVKQRFGVVIHRSTLERGLRRLKKKHP